MLTAEGVEGRASCNKMCTNVFQEGIGRCIKMQHGAAPCAIIRAQSDIACCNATSQGLGMDSTVDDIIAALKAQFRVGTDQGLADRLKLGRSTVTSWRRRGVVPERYARFASSLPTLLPDLVDPGFDEVERKAIVLALMRLIRGYGQQIVDYRAYLSKGGFLPAQLAVGVEQALLDLAAKMAEENLDDAQQALNLIVLEELFPAG